MNGLNVSRDFSYFQNVVNVELFKKWKSVEKLFNSPKRYRWQKSSFAIVVNAFYQPKSNRIIFPAAFLKNNVFDSNVPSYMNFGGVGAVVGHEITHGFDDNGRKFDLYGEKRKLQVRESRNL